jgi:hypothetical protein
MELLGQSVSGISFRSVLKRCSCRCKIGAWLALNVPQAPKSFWTHSMVLLGDEVQVEADFSPFADSANLNAILVHCLRQTYHRLIKSFDLIRWKS